VWLAGASLASDRAVAALGARGTLLACCLLIAAGYGGLAAGEAAASFLFYLCLMTVRGLQGPILLQYLQREAPAGDRASVLSLNAMLFRAAFVLTGPLVGLVVERLGMAAALAILGTALTLVALAALAAFARAHAAAR
jgi:predicted ABC-type exoprotein transport system permease subunit